MRTFGKMPWRVFATITLLTCVFTNVTAAAAREPLLQEGKKTIYERVLTRPSARLAAQPGEKGKLLPAFSRFYVYGRKQLDNAEWLEVGANHQGKIDGWLQAGGTVPWKQQLALSFTNPAGRNPVLFFDERDALSAVLEAEKPASIANPLYESLKKPPRDPHIVSVEPAEHVDINKNFYLLPVVESEEIYSGSGRTVRVLKVASVTKQTEEEKKAAEAQAAADKKKDQSTLLRGFSSALVFVIDSTISMGPYIERTKEAVQRVYDRVEKAGLLDKVKFGLVAYRSSVDETPALGYVAKEFVDPMDVKDGADFLSKVRDLKPADVSSGRQFDEDAYAGVMQALDNVAWRNFGARYLVLVTDAGALSAEHRLSGTGLDAEQVRSEALHRGVAVYTMHLKTPQGKSNHASAQSQYQQLSSHPLLSRPLYYPVELGDVDAFGRNVDLLAEAIVAQVRGAALGKKVAGSALTADSNFGRGDDGKKKSDDVEQRVQEEVAMLGHAMELDYLGSVGDTGAPEVLQAWITDVDLKDPLRRSLEVRVLLTKNQLSDMQLVMRGILDASSKGIIAPDDFFNNLRSFAASLGRDPNRVTDAQTVKLADLGLLGEYLDDLPYRSDLMNLDQDTWSSWSVTQQTAFTNKIRRNMRLYEIYNSDVDRWISLAPGSNESEHVYPVPIDVLP